MKVQFLLLPLFIFSQKDPYQPSASRSNDLIHTRLEVSFDWQNARLLGKATLIFKPYFYPITSCHLNARGMEIKNVQGQIESRQNKKSIVPLSLDYTLDADSLKIRFKDTLYSEQTYTLFIDYIARPEELKTSGSAAIRSDKGLYFINYKGTNPYKMPQIWTQGETQSNSVWFPTIDNPIEKTTQEIFITVDKKYTTLSNGILVSSRMNADGTRTDYWKMDIPHSPYLFMMAVGEFKKITDSPWKGKEISYYVEKECEKYAKIYFKNTREMIDFYSRILQFDYPWPKYAQVVVRDYVSGAMENTSATLHGEMVIYCGERDLKERNRGESVIAHELFHQWFGDVATCESWSNLPLNESFATYGEYLWMEYKFGSDRAEQHRLSSRAGYFAQAESKQVPLIRYHYDFREEMFDGFSYNKGGQILHLLRKTVGDAAFFKSLNVYLNRRKFQSAEIHDLRLAFEEVTGRDMNWFFDQWFLKPGHPELEISQEYRSSEKKLYLKVEQKQDSTWPTYRLPVLVDVFNGSSRKTFSLDITQRKQEFVFDISEAPSLVLFDADARLLAKITHNKSTNEWLHQYKHVSLFPHRLEALKNLYPQYENPAVFDVIASSMNDPFSGIRSRTLRELESMKKKYPDKITELCLKTFKEDSDLTNRAEALELLLNRDDIKGKDSLCDLAFKMGSAGLVSQVLKYYSSTNPDKAYSLAKSISKEEDSKSVLINIASIFAKKANPSDVDFFRSKFVYLGEFELMSFLTHYINFGKKISDPMAVLKVAEDLLVFARGESFVKTGCVNGLRFLLNKWKPEEKNNNEDVKKLIAFLEKSINEVKS